VIFIKENRLSDVTSHLTRNHLFICAYLLYKLINDGEKLMYIKMFFKLMSLNPNDPRFGRHLKHCKRNEKVENHNCKWTQNMPHKGQTW
jgi:hypothetical protein